MDKQGVSRSLNPRADGRTHLDGLIDNVQDKEQETQYGRGRHTKTVLPRVCSTSNNLDSHPGPELRRCSKSTIS